MPAGPARGNARPPGPPHACGGWKGKPMKRLLLMDARDYDPGLPEIRRVAVRGIIQTGSRMLFAQDCFGMLKLPGGGREEGESDVDTLVREVAEETGYRVIPETAAPFGYIEEKRKSIHEEMIWHQFSRLYFCQVEADRGACHFTGNEQKYGLHFAVCPLEDALENNRRVLEKEGPRAWNQREYKTLLLIREYLKS